MLLFSEYMRELLEIKNMSISELSRASGIERTQLSKTLTGQRKLPYHMLDKLIYHLRLTPGEEKQIRAYYEAQFEKEGMRRSREVIDKLFGDLACFDFGVPIFEETKLLLHLEDYAKERSVFLGETNVKHLIRMAISEEAEHEDARLEMTVPPANTFLNEELLKRYLDDRMSMEISQIICFDASRAESDINIYNLECFSRILPLCLLSGQQYHPYYYYDNNASRHYTDPFPYFLITHTCVIGLSEDGTCAVLMNLKDQVSYYQRYFQSLLSQCYSLIQYTSDPLEILKLYQKCTDADGFYMAMAQPCFGRFYTDEFIAGHLRQELPMLEGIFQAAADRFAHLRQVSDFQTAFSEEGLRRFMESGTLDDFPTELVVPFTREEQVGLMRRLETSIRTGDVQGYLFREKSFPNYLAMCTSSEGGVGFFTTSRFPLSDGLCSIWIGEPGLCQAFHGWLTHLSGSPLTLTSEELLEKMKSMIRQSK